MNADTNAFEIQNILVPVDFSPRSTASVGHAEALAKHFGARVILMHAIPPSPYNSGMLESGYSTAGAWPPLEEVRERIGVQLKDMAATVRSEHEVETHVSHGDPAGCIEQSVKDYDADLIVIPTHGYGPFRRFLIGSVTAKILHDVSCPVLTGAHVSAVSDSPSGPYRRVACAVDLFSPSANALKWAMGFAESWGADLHVIHAGGLLGMSPDEKDLFTPAFLEHVTEMKEKEVREFLAQNRCEARIHVGFDPVDNYVTKTLGEIGAEALVIGRTPHELWERMHAHAFALIRESPCPVISV